MKKLIIGIALLMCVLFCASCSSAGALVGQWYNTSRGELCEYKSNGDFTVSTIVLDENGNIADSLIKTKGKFLVDGEIIKEFVTEEREIKEKDGVLNYTGKIKSSAKINEYMFQETAEGQITRAVPEKDADGNIIGATKAEILQAIN